MRFARLLAAAGAFLLLACQPTTPPIVTILYNKQIIRLETDERVPLALLEQAGITLDTNDRLLLNGLPFAPEQPITNHQLPNYQSPNYPITLQVRRAIPITLITPDGERQIQSQFPLKGDEPEVSTFVSKPAFCNSVVSASKL